MIQPGLEQNDILIVDDTRENLRVLIQILTEQGYRARPVLNGELALQVIRKAPPDLILLDILMPGVDGYEICRRLKAEERTRDIPIIFISALDETMDKIKAFDLGGVDYITKPFQAEEVLARVQTHLSLRNMQVRMETQNRQLQQEISERKQAENALRNSEEKLKTIMNAATDAIILLDDCGKIIYSNPISEMIFGYSVEELYEKEIDLILAPDEFQKAFGKRFGEFREIGEEQVAGKTIEVKAVRKNGLGFPVEISISTLEMNGKWHAVGIVRDITERKKIQQENIRARKFESLGILAAGIAHDFNNLLYIIMGNINLAEDDIKPEIGRSDFLEEAENACLKAKELTMEFLTLSPGGAPHKKIGSIEEVLRKTADLALSDSNARCDFSSPKDLWRVEFDENQMKQAVENIVRNAAESMPDGGSVIVKVENIAEADTEITGTKSPFDDGNYIRIIISDNGIGISEENLTRIFDPYFSTKTRGTAKGMGLGLTIAWSVISRHDGRITVESEVGAGTTFAIYLPAFEKKKKSKKIGCSKRKGPRDG